MPGVGLEPTPLVLILKVNSSVTVVTGLFLLTVLHAPRNVYKVVHAEKPSFSILILTPNLNPIAICTPVPALAAVVVKGDI